VIGWRACDETDRQDPISALATELELNVEESDAGIVDSILKTDCDKETHIRHSPVLHLDRS